MSVLVTNIIWIFMYKTSLEFFLGKKIYKSSNITYILGDKYPKALWGDRGRTENTLPDILLIDFFS